MGWFSFLILGIIAGVIAKLILRQKAGWFLTIILGVLGAMVVLAIGLQHVEGSWGEGDEGREVVGHWCRRC